MQTLKIINTSYVTHDVKRFVLEKPEGFVYRPGQSAHISIDLPGWENQIRKFTFTSLNDWPFLEFTIKIYENRNSVTNQLTKLNAGAALLLHDVFGTIEYKGPGVFIAGGTGITPFMAIFRALFLSGNMRGNGLIYSNKSQDDIIYAEELTKMLGPAYVNVFTRQGVIGFKERHIDRRFLIETIKDFNTRFYVCGPKSFTEDITRELISLGTSAQSLII
jgi:ferredoxin-NADP reductase